MDGAPSSLARASFQRRDSLSEDSHDIRFVLENINTGETATYDSIFRGPK